MKIRSHQKSDGTTIIWKWPAKLGDNYMGPEVQVTYVKKKINPERKAELEASEARVKAMDDRIRRHHTVEPAAGVALPFSYRTDPDPGNKLPY